MLRMSISLALTLVACLPAKRSPVYTVRQTFTVKRPPSEAAASRDARAALSSAKTVAFAPPEQCPEEGCGAFMAQLERGAIGLGFDVIPWQSLRGGDSPVAQARARAVHILFQVDELRFGGPASDLYHRVDTDFVDAASGRSIAVRNAAAVAKRCVLGTHSALKPELVLALDIKAISVQDGRVVWTYRTTRTGLTPGRVVTMHMDYRASSSYRLKGQKGWKIGLGVASVVVAATAGLASLIVDGTSGSKVDLPMTLYAAEALLLGTGIYWLATANDEAHWGYSKPEHTLCVPGRLVGPAPGPVVRTGTASSAMCTETCRQRRKLAARAAAELFRRVSELRR